MLLYTVGLWLGNCAREGTSITIHCRAMARELCQREGTSVTIHCRAMARELCQRGYQYYYTL